MSNVSIQPILINTMRIIIILVCRANNFEVIKRDNNAQLPAQSAFDPVGRLLERYWSSFGRNGFEKLKKCADIIRNWPTTSTSLEKSFGQISTHHKTQSGFIHCETLLALHNSMGPSQEFMKAFCATCRAHNIKMD